VVSIAPPGLMPLRVFALRGLTPTATDYRPGGAREPQRLGIQSTTEHAP
jgi:hypothetical protein